MKSIALTVFLGWMLLMPKGGVAQVSQASVADEGRLQKPNVVFIIADDMHRYMFNCLPEGKGKNLTPHLDRLAAEGTLMMGQYVASPVCTPSRYNCLTGLYASRSKCPAIVAQTKKQGQTVVQWTSFITDEPTLAKHFQQAGYVTGMVGKNHVIDGHFEKIGYHEDPHDPDVARRLKERQAKINEAMKRGGFDYVASIYFENPDSNGPRELAVHNLDWTTDGALRFIDANKDRPFFLYYALTVPHGPGAPKRSWNANPLAVPTGFLEEPLNVLPPRKTIPKRIKAAGLKPTSQRCNLLWLDDSVGAILDRLKTLGIDDHTIVVFFNDHGQAAKGTLYQGGISDPSIFWKKGGFPSGGVNHSLVSNIDFAPTLLELAGVPYDPATFDGVSFVPALNNTTGRPVKIHESLYFEMGYSRAVIKDGWKYLALRYPEYATSMTVEQRAKILDRFNRKQKDRGRPIYTHDPNAPFSHISLIPGGGDAEAKSTGKKECYYDPDQLFHLEDDPGETRNLASQPEYAQQLEAMKNEMQKYLQDLPGRFAELKPDDSFAPQQELTPKSQP